MEAALNSFVEIETDLQKVAILGDMLELGSISKSEHQDMISFAKQLPIDLLLFCGKEFYAVQDKQQLFFEEKTELIHYLESNPIENAYVLLKGSRGIGLESLVSLF